MFHRPEESSTGVFGLIGLWFLVVRWGEEFDHTVFPAHPTVDLHIQGDKHAVGETLMEGLDSCGVVLVVDYNAIMILS